MALIFQLHGRGGGQLEGAELGLGGGGRCGWRVTAHFARFCVFVEGRVGRGTVSSGFGLVGSGKPATPGRLSLSDASLRKTTVRARRELDERVRGGMRGARSACRTRFGSYRVCVEGGRWRAREEVACVVSRIGIVKVPLHPRLRHLIG